MTTVLIAEDNDDLRKLTRLQLQKHGFSCVEAAAGNEVLEALSVNSIDLVLMDMNMPGLDGWEATTAIRKELQYANLPIIALTAYSLQGDRARATAAGCNAFHCKPVEIDKLLDDIKRLLKST
ncbi:MAG: response regulator [Pirellulaceae bacterium]|nr:response regulator [Pirellulaceae bacterium]